MDLLILSLINYRDKTIEIEYEKELRVKIIFHISLMLAGRATSAQEQI